MNILRDISKFEKPYWVEIGCGESPLPPFDRWIHTDFKTFYTTDHVEIECSGYELPFKGNEVGKIWLAGVWEHFSYHECELAIENWDRCLVDGGEIYFNFPPIDDYIRRYNEGEVNWDWLMGAIYGWQRFEKDFHRSGWCEKTIIEFLKKWEKKYQIEIIYAYHKLNGELVTFEKLTDWDCGIHIWVKMVKNH
jgi:hypothetical protein